MDGLWWRCRHFSKAQAACVEDEDGDDSVRWQWSHVRSGLLLKTVSSYCEMFLEVTFPIFILFQLLSDMTPVVPTPFYIRLLLPRTTAVSLNILLWIFPLTCSLNNLVAAIFYITAKSKYFLLNTDNHSCSADNTELPLHTNNFKLEGQRLAPPTPLLQAFDWLITSTDNQSCSQSLKIQKVLYCTFLKYNFKALVLHFSISILCHVILHYIFYKISYFADSYSWYKI